MPLINELQKLWFLDKMVDFTLRIASIFGTHYLFVHSQSYDRNDKLFIQNIAWELRFHFWYFFAKSSKYIPSTTYLSTILLHRYTYQYSILLHCLPWEVGDYNFIHACHWLQFQKYTEIRCRKEWLELNGKHK